MRLSSVLLTREEFLVWIGSGSAAFSSAAHRGDRTSSSRGAVTLLLNETVETSSAQPIVAIPLDEMDEFFAFTTTYITTFKPYTAFYHVIPLELADAIKDRRSPDASKKASFARMVAGGARAESSLASRSRSGTSFGSALIAANATLCAALGAAAIAGYSPAIMPWIAEQWASLHLEAGRQTGLPEAGGGAASIWQLVSSTVRTGHDKAKPLREASTAAIASFVDAALTGGINSQLLRQLGHSLSRDTSLAEMLAASREERINFFNQYVSNMGQATSDGIEGPFMAGLLLAIAGNGSFEMLRSARDLAERSPIAIIWFGICAALFDDSNVLTGANCLGRRISRDLDRVKDAFDLPEADLSAFEYRAINRDSMNLEQVNVRSTDAFCLEILPDVVTYIPRGSKNAEIRSLDEYHVLAESFREIRYIIDRTTRRLEKSEDPRSRDLYGNDSKSRKRLR